MNESIFTNITLFPHSKGQYIPQRLSDAAYLTIGVYLTLLGAMAFFGNVLFIVVLLAGKPRFSKFHKLMLFNMSLSDLGVACTAYPLTAISGFLKRWIFDDIMCVIAGFTAYTFILSDMNTLAVIAFSRYVIVCKPEWGTYRQDSFFLSLHLLMAGYLLKGKYPKYFLIGIWTYTLFWTVTPLLGFGNYTHEPFGTSCTLNWHARQTVNIIYNSLCLIGCYLIHVVSFVFCYAHVIRGHMKMCQATVNISALRPSSHESEQNMAVEAIISYRKIVSTSHLTKVSLTMIVLFFVAWTPYAALTVWNMFNEPVDANVQVLPTMFAKISCAFNPVVYGFLSDRFRQTARRLFLKKPMEQPNRSKREDHGNAWRRSFNGPMTVNGIYIGTHCIHVCETEVESRL